MSYPHSVDKQSPHLPSNWSNLWFNSPNKALNHVIFTMHLKSLAKHQFQPHKTLIFDRTLLLPDSLLLRVFQNLPDSQRKPLSLVCKRWMSLHGRLVRALTLLEWDFLESGRLILRFPNLTRIDLVHACVVRPPSCGVLLSHRVVSVPVDSQVSEDGFLENGKMLASDVVDRGLRCIAGGYPNLRKFSVVGASELGLLSLAEECCTLQELELHRCGDDTLRAISGFGNLQILKLIGTAEGLYKSWVSDMGLTILAQGCGRLVKLELSGCEGSYDGIKAIGQCCQMLEELTLSDHRLESGWLSALSYCENLKALNLQSCRWIDVYHPELEGHLGCSCPTLERLHLHKCRLRDKWSMRALYMVCGGVREFVIQDCWGLDNDILGLAAICRYLFAYSLQLDLFAFQLLFVALSVWTDLTESFRYCITTPFLYLLL